MKTARPSRARRRERGEVSWVGLVMLLAMAAGAWAAWSWIPIYMKRQEIEQVVRATGNAAVKNGDDAALVARMVKDIQALHSVDFEDEYGRRQRVPLVELDPRDVTWERDTAANKLHIAFTYVLPVTYQWLERRDEHVVDLDLVVDITRPDWGSK